jgi:CNP1-like family
VRGSALTLALVALAACGTKPREESDWERRNTQSAPAEEEVALPPYPTRRNLVEFGVIGADGFHFFIDRPSLAVGKDGIVRYVLVARSPEGAENVTYEGLRCASGEQRVFALGRPDGTWSMARSTWRPLATARHITLYREYFCPQNEPLGSADEGIRALESGGHPFAKRLGSYR